MPNIKSAKKRVKVNNTKAALNKARKTNLKTVIKNAENAIANSADNKQETVALALKKIDQAANKGLIHKNNAAHKKSAMTVALNKMD